MAAAGKNTYAANCDKKNGSASRSFYHNFYFASRIEATAMRVKMTHASARVISFAAL